MTTDAFDGENYLWDLSSAVHVNPANGQIGIGDNAPNRSLSTYTGSLTGIMLRGPSSTHWYIDNRGDLDGLGHDFWISNGTSTPHILADGSTDRVAIRRTSANYTLHVGGSFGFSPGTSEYPVNNGDVVFEFTSNTQFTIRARGTDGTIRSAVLTLS